MARECGLRVEKGSLAYPCTVQINDGAPAHRGPCMAVEVPSSVRARQKWQTEADAAHRSAEGALRGASGGGGVVTPVADLRYEEALPHPAAAREADRQARIAAQAEREEAAERSAPKKLVTEADFALRGDGQQWTTRAEYEARENRTEGTPQPDDPPVVCTFCGLLFLQSWLPDHMATKHPEARVRPEDQPLPTPNDRPSSHDELVKMIESRKALGLKRYNSLLQPFNGRNGLQDFLEELIDGSVYAITAMVEAQELAQVAEMVAFTVMGSSWYKEMSENDRAAMATSLGKIVGWFQRVGSV